MKKTSKIVALLMILVMTAIMLTGCETKTGREINAKELSNYTEYTHSSGVKFSYPSEWKSMGTSSAPQFMNNTTGTNVNLQSESTAVNLKTYVTAAVAGLKKQYGSNIKGDISEEFVKLNGKDACILTYKINQYNIDMVAKQAVFMDSKTAYVLTVVLRESNEGTDTEIAENIISSFKK